MRIALVAPFGLRAKGTTRARALPLARALAGRGHTVALFIPPYDSPEDSGQCRQDSGADIVNVVLPKTGLGTGSLWHFRLAARLLRAVREWRPDVAHVFKPKGPSGLVGTMLWTMWCGRPQSFVPPNHGSTLSRTPYDVGETCRLVVDSDDWEGPGGWNDDPRAGYSRLQRRFFAWQERYGLSHANAWTVTSACLRDRAIAAGANGERVLILHNGVMASRIRLPSSSFQSPTVGNRRSVVLYTRFAGVRVPDVVVIWQRVAAVVPEARLAVVGRGLAGEEAELARLPGVDVAGWVEPEMLPGLLAGMAVAMVPWADTLSNRARHSAKVLELMAAGLPVVAYAVGELPETLGETGILVPPGDDLAFAQAVVGLLADRERADRLGSAAQLRVRAEFTWERLVEIALQAYGAAGVVQGNPAVEDAPFRSRQGPRASNSGELGGTPGELGELEETRQSHG